MTERIIIVGTGGFAREVLWLVREMQQAGQSLEIAGLVAESPDFPAAIAGVPVLGTDETMFAQIDRSLQFVVAIGNPKIRYKIAQQYENQSFIAASPLIHPSVLIGTDTRIDNGSIICAGSIITTDIHIEKHCLINLHCSVGHDCRISQSVTLHPGVRLSGAVQVGEMAELGTSAVVLPGLRLASAVRVGAGAVVTRDLEQSGATFTGIPAKFIKN